VTEPRPFQVAVPEEVLADLRERLDRVRWPDEVPDGGWAYGTDRSYMQELVDYWRNGYDWRKAEAGLNELPQFTVPLSGIEVHFVHQPGAGPAPMPLLLAHGWPGSFFEFHRLVPLLTDPGGFGADPADAFTVVAPSLPGYVFSYRPGQPRLDLAGMADVFAALMNDVLGYRRFGAQGGDWGAGVVSALAAAQPDRLVGLHVNLLFVRPERIPPRDRTAEEAAYFEALEEWQREGLGYQWIQGTKPQTLAYGLTDSPVGLAAWMVEKYRAWSDCGGDVERRFSKDVLLTTVMLYWVTGAINSSFWPYYAVRHGSPALPKGKRVEVPTAYAEFPGEMLHPPRSWAERTFDIRRWTKMPSGGHFAALEEPEALAEDIRAFFRPLREPEEE
jgi:pimeloyl-ACP methyl ester carboxylesterase